MTVSQERCAKIGVLLSVGWLILGLGVGFIGGRSYGYWLGYNQVIEQYHRGGYDTCMLIVENYLGWDRTSAISQCNHVEAMVLGWGLFEKESSGWRWDWIIEKSEGYK